MTAPATSWTTNLPGVPGAYFARSLGETQSFVVEVADTPDGLMVNIQGSPMAREFEDGWLYICEMNNDEFEWQGPLLPADEMAAELVAVQVITESIATGQCWSEEHGDSEAVGPISLALENAASRLCERNEENTKLLIKSASQLLALRSAVSALQASKTDLNEHQWKSVQEAMTNSDSVMALAETILAQ